MNSTASSELAGQPLAVAERQRRPSNVVALILLGGLAVLMQAFLNLVTPYIFMGRGFAWYLAFWICVLSVILLERVSRRAVKAWISIIALIVLMDFIPWSARHALIHDLRKVKVGMTKQDAAAAMHRHMRSEEASTDGNTWFFRHDETSADLGSVIFENGRVSSVDYSPD